MPWLATEGSPVGPLLFAFAFLWLSLAVGRRLLICLGGGGAGTLAERGIIASALGAGALQYVVFALGAAGALGVWSIRIAACAVALASTKDLSRVAVAGWRAVRPRAHLEPWTIAWIVALSPAIVISAMLALIPTVDPDGLGYHLTVPKRWLSIGSLQYLPTYPYSNAPMGLEMLYALAMAIAGDSAAKCIHFTLGTLGGVGLYLAGKRLQGPMTGAVSATLFMVGPLGITIVLGCAFVEGAAAFAMIAAALAWMLWFYCDERALLRCAFLLAGLAATFKITSGLFPVALSALTCVAYMDPARSGVASRKRWIDAIAFSARFVPLVLVPIAPWLTRSTIVTGNPVFPLFARWIPSRDLSPDLSTKFDRFNRYMTWGNAFGRDWSIEQRGKVLLGIGMVVAILGVFVFARMRSWMARGTTAVIVVTALVQIMAAGLYVRYAIPLAAVLMLPLAAAVEPQLTRRPIPAIWLALTLVCSCLQARRCVVAAGSDLKSIVLTAVGLEERRTFLLATVRLYPLYEEINRDLPSSARVLLATYCGGFYIDRTTFCGEMVQDSLRYTTWDAFTSDLRSLGITHVIAPNVLATGGPSPPLDRSNTSSITREDKYRVLRPLLVGHSRVLGVADDEGLYEVEPAFLNPH